MKLTAAALTLTGLAAFAPSTVFAPAPQQGDKPRAEEHSVLEERMHGIEDQLKILRRALRDPARNADSLSALARLQADAVAAKSETPRMLSKLPEAERAKFASDYRREMVVFLEGSLAVEKALLEGRQEDAQKALEALRDMEDPAHSRFTEEEH